MATPTGITVAPRGEQQFRGVFSHAQLIRFTIDPGSIASNGIDATTVPVPGMDPLRDVVIGWTHVHAGAHAHEYVETVHTWTDELHLVLHNITAGPLDPPSTEYLVVVARLI